jgi:hypothetical protein
VSDGRFMCPTAGLCVRRPVYVSDGWVLCHNSLSNLYRRAISEGCVRAGYNPVQSMMDKPRDIVASREADWLEMPRAAPS